MKTTTWQRFRHGTATVSIGQPHYGSRRRIIANAPCTKDGFADLNTALAAAQLECGDDL